MRLFLVVASMVGSDAAHRSAVSDAAAVDVHHDGDCASQTDVLA